MARRKLEGTPLLGVTLRAYRLGYRRVPGDRDYWLCISGEPDAWSLHFVPLAGPITQSRGRSKEIYRAWWEADDGGVALCDTFPIRHVLTVKRPFTIRIDDEGRLR